MLPNALTFEGAGVADGIRTHDRWNHNPELYQLSYGHRCFESTTQKCHNNSKIKNGKCRNP